MSGSPWPALHPRLGQLLHDDGWHSLTAPQEAALQPLLAGQHALVVAPTGQGKTEAAMLPVLSRILAERDALDKKGKTWPTGFKALYITPLRALNRDLMGRLQGWAKSLDLGLGVRHGDTSQAERSKQARNPPDILITTPESLQLLLYGDTLRRHLKTVRFVVLDEVHDLVQSERGAQLLCALERLEEAIGEPATITQTVAKERVGPTKPHARAGGAFQRIGLSATVADPKAVARLMGGRGPDDKPRAVTVVKVDVVKAFRLQVDVALATEADETMAGELGLPPDAMAHLRAIRELAATHQRLLVFQNTRDGAELLASRSALLDGQGPALLGLHHGSLSAEHREDVEANFKQGRLRALVATSSLELGIDIGAIDHVAQVQSPRSVARLVQRLGRAGHRAGAVSEGTLIASGAEDALECLAVARRALEGRLEPLRVRGSPLVVLANQLVALSNEYAGLDRGWTRAVLARAGCFDDLDDALFDAVWDGLLELRSLLPDTERPARIGRSGRGRKQFLEHLSMIQDERSYRIVDQAAGRGIGTADEAYVAAALSPGTLFIMAGRSWQVIEVDAAGQKVRVAPAKDLGAIPQWTGSQLPVSFEVAQEVARLRRALADDDKVELAKYPGSPAGWAEARTPIDRQKEAGLAVPTDAVVTLESAKRVLVANVALGTRGNEALARVTQALWSQRLGSPVGIESDAYRIQFTLPTIRPAAEVLDIWKNLRPEGVEMLLGMALRESPSLRQHLVHVAKQFGALPKQLDATKTTRGKIDQLLTHAALGEEATSRLVFERMDVGAVEEFLGKLQAETIEVVVQAMGPISTLGQEDARRLVAIPKNNDALLAAVRVRVEDADVLMACCSCGHNWPDVVRTLPVKPRCRRCASIQIACLRPWHADCLNVLTKSDQSMDEAEKVDRERFIRNGALVASFGDRACKLLVGRGIGPDTAGRILQKVSDPKEPAFWRELLQAELTFARTNAFWKR